MNDRKEIRMEKLLMCAVNKKKVETAKYSHI